LCVFRSEKIQVLQDTQRARSPASNSKQGKKLCSFHVVESVKVIVKLISAVL